MTDAYIGEVRCFGFNFAPNDWAQCNGQLLPIQQYTALFSLLGTMYGGNGQTTFGLPDLRGRSAIGAGQGPGLGSY
ncbi:MAG TPA: tail fiber protein, partial [Micropruina sp.]|nr:tail fiber protein [Micropruina sp.]